MLPKKRRWGYGSFNVVSEIKGRYSDGCCYDCDGIYKYNHKKVPVLYLKIYIRPLQI